jgi:hypothetical protein
MDRYRAVDLRQSANTSPSEDRRPVVGGLKSTAALALGALAVGALAIGALAIGRLAIGHARIRRLEIDELVVRKLRVIDELETPSNPYPKQPTE